MARRSFSAGTGTYRGARRCGRQRSCWGPAARVMDRDGEIDKKADNLGANPAVGRQRAVDRERTRRRLWRRLREIKRVGSAAENSRASAGTGPRPWQP